MKFCKDCKYNDDMGRFGNWCNRPSGTINMVTGYPNRVNKSARVQRSSSDPDDCGAEAKFFKGDNLYSIKVRLFGE